MSTNRFWSLCVVVLAFLTLLVAWGISSLHLDSHTGVVAERLQLLNELRKGAAEEYFATAEAEVRFWSSNPDILAAQQKLNTLWQSTPDKPAALSRIRQFYITNNPHGVGDLNALDDAGDGSDYSQLHANLHPMAKLFVSMRGYYDVFLIGTEGDIFYTVEKESDYGTNLLDGEWRDTGLAEVYRKAVAQAESGVVAISDMEPYGPSGGAPAIFIARALKDEEGGLLGVIAFQLPTAAILKIMNYTSGMGDTGETYLVGQDHLMRSDSRFSEDTSVLKQLVDTPTSNKALAGHRGVEFVADYRGVQVLSAYTNMEVGETSWAVIAEIDRDEVILGAALDRPNLTGILLFFYGLSLWSVWYWRARPLAGEGEQYAGMDLDLDPGDFGDGSPG